jgi:hypothetical protein
MPNKTSFFNQSGLAGAAYTEQSFDSAVGQALKYVRLNADETSMEFRTIAETLADLNLEIGTDVQAYDSYLQSISALLNDNDTIIYSVSGQGVTTATNTVLTAFARTLIDDATAAGMRSTLELGSMALKNLESDGGLILTSVSPGSGVGPNLILNRDSATPAVGDLIGSLIFRGKNNLDEDIDYATIRSIIVDETDGTEDAGLTFYSMEEGVEVKSADFRKGWRIGSTGITDYGNGFLHAENGLYVNDEVALSRTAVPATATSTGISGQVAYNVNYFYVCTSANTWRRVALATW